MTSLSPTAITVELALRDVPGGPWTVRDDPDSYHVLVTDGRGDEHRLWWHVKMSGCWFQGDDTLGAEADGAIYGALGYTYSTARAVRHMEWRAPDRLRRLVPDRGVVSEGALYDALWMPLEDLLDVIATMPDITVRYDGCAVVGSVP